MPSKHRGPWMLRLLLAALLLAVSGGSVSALAPGRAEQSTWAFVPMSESAQWLSAAFPDEAAAIASAVAGVTQMGTSEPVAPEVRAWAHYLASRAFAALTGRAPQAQIPALEPPSQLPQGLLKSLVGVELSVCVGLDVRAEQDAGAAPGLLVRLEGGQPVVLPENWLVLSKPPEGNRAWQPLACQVLLHDQGQRNR